MIRNLISKVKDNSNNTLETNNRVNESLEIIYELIIENEILKMYNFQTEDDKRTIVLSIIAILRPFTLLESTKIRSQKLIQEIYENSGNKLKNH